MNLVVEARSLGAPEVSSLVSQVPVEWHPVLSVFAA